MWKSLYKEIDIRVPVGESVPKCSEASLDKYENTTGFRFPRSYRTFVAVFGPGEIGGYFNIYAPGYKHITSGDITAFQAMLTNADIVDAFLTTYNHKDILTRMVPFSDTIGGDVIFWDPIDLTIAKNSEYGIYALPDDTSKIVKLARTFRDFIRDVCLGDGVRHLIGATEYTPPQQFVPFTKSRTR